MERRLMFSLFQIFWPVIEKDDSQHTEE